MSIDNNILALRNVPKSTKMKSSRYLFHKLIPNRIIYTKCDIITEQCMDGLKKEFYLLIFDKNKITVSLEALKIYTEHSPFSHI